MIHKLKTIALTHRNTPIEEIAKFYIPQEEYKVRLDFAKQALNIEEIMLLSTCNRVEFTFVCDTPLGGTFVRNFLKAVYPTWTDQEVKNASIVIDAYEGNEAIQHLFNVASSIDSLVIGEREIITQVRKAYDTCKELNLTGDLIRLAVKQTIETAKEVYTYTEIANNPVSVVSLAFRNLKALNISKEARILLVGAGVTNANMAKYLKKHGFVNFSVFNRTFSKAETLAKELNGTAYNLDALQTFDKGFDVLISCTAAANTLITEELFVSLLKGEKGKKIVIDLALPCDVAATIIQKYSVNYIDIKSLEAIAKENLSERENELEACKKIIARRVEEFKGICRHRQVEKAMSALPQKVQELKHTMISEVFAREINNLDAQSRETLDKVISYMEKKMVSIPMKIAKEILIED